EGGLPAAQPLQDRGRSEPVGHLSARGLEVAQRAAGFAAEAAVRLAHVVTARGQALLQLVTFLPPHSPFVAPRLTAHPTILLEIVSRWRPPHPASSRRRRDGRRRRSPRRSA